MSTTHIDGTAPQQQDETSTLQQPLLPQHAIDASPNVSKPIATPSIPPGLFALHLLLTFAQNLPTVSIGLLLVNSMHWSTSQLTWYWTLIFVPWMVRPVYAYLSDRAAGLGNSHAIRRRYYIVLGNVWSIVGLLMQATVISSMSLTVPSSSHSLTVADVLVGVGGVVLNVGLAMSSVANDALGVEYGNWCVRQAKIATSEQAQQLSSDASAADIEQQEVDDDVTSKPIVRRINVQPRPGIVSKSMEDDDATAHALKAAVQAQCMLARTYGSLTSAALSIALSATIAPTTALLSTVLVYLAITLVTRAYNQAEYVDADELTTPDQPVHPAKPAAWYQLLLPHWPTLLFLFLYNSIPSADDAWFTFLYDQHTTTLTPSCISTIAFISTVGSVVGIYLYQRTALNVSLVRIVVIGTLMGALVNCSKLVVVQHLNTRVLHMPDSLYIPLQILITTIVATFTVIPQLMFSTIHIASANAQYEALIYSSFQCVQHLGTLVGNSIAAGVTGAYAIGVDGHYEMLSEWIVVCSLLSLTPLAALPCLMRKGPSSRGLQ